GWSSRDASGSTATPCPACARPRTSSRPSASLPGCWSCTTGSMRPEVCIGAIAVYDECLLMIRRGRGPAAGEWSVPGGRVESGETLAEAVVRELAEETGIEAVCDELVGWVERIGDDHH